MQGLSKNYCLSMGYVLQDQLACQASIGKDIVEGRFLEAVTGGGTMSGM